MANKLFPVALQQCREFNFKKNLDLRKNDKSNFVKWDVGKKVFTNPYSRTNNRSNLFQNIGICNQYLSLVGNLAFQKEP